MEKQKVQNAIQIHKILNDGYNSLELTESKLITALTK